jgi:hypothetical protein
VECPADELIGLDLNGLTAYTVGILRRAHAAGLRPVWGQPRGNARRIVLNGPGPHSAFGSLTIGAKTGKVLRAEIVYGNDPDARVVVAAGANAVRDVIGGLSPSVCREDCAASSTAVCSRR